MSATDLYERALESTPAKVVPRLAGAVSDGYWIDDQRYFYSVGVVDAAGRRAVPMIADVVARTSQPVLELGRIAELLSAQKGSPVALVDLANASYDMPTAMTLVVTLGTEAYHLDAKEASIVKVETIDPTLALYSPDGKFACFLKGHAVWMRKRGNGHGQPLTREAAGQQRCRHPPGGSPADDDDLADASTGHSRPPVARLPRRLPALAFDARLRSLP